MSSVNIRSLTGDDAINEHLNHAMQQTVEALVRAGHLKDEDAQAFLNEHACMLVAQQGGFMGWVKRAFPSMTSGQSLIVIAKMNV